MDALVLFTGHNAGTMSLMPGACLQGLVLIRRPLGVPCRLPPAWVGFTRLPAAAASRQMLRIPAYPDGLLHLTWSQWLTAPQPDWGHRVLVFLAPIILIYVWRFCHPPFHFLSPLPIHPHPDPHPGALPDLLSSPDSAPLLYLGLGI